MSSVRGLSVCMCSCVRACLRVCMFVQCVDVVRALLSECARVRRVCACACGYMCFLSSCLNVV